MRWQSLFGWGLVVGWWVVLWPVVGWVRRVRAEWRWRRRQYAESEVTRILGQFAAVDTDELEGRRLAHESHTALMHGCTCPLPTADLVVTLRSGDRLVSVPRGPLALSSAPAERLSASVAPEDDPVLRLELLRAGERLAWAVMMSWHCAEMRRIAMGPARVELSR